MSINLVKIHATESTNDELKSRFRESELPQLTTIYTDHQTAGKGQMGASWVSEPYKNLTFSTLFVDSFNSLTDFEINKFITVCLVEWLRQKLQIKAVIKWPNDILSVNHKLGGILIERIIQNNQRKATIVGIGLNVNQTDFGELSKAISLKLITGKSWELDQLLLDFLNFIELRIDNCREHLIRYESLLFKYGQLTTFEKDEKKFTAIVHGVSDSGKLILITNGIKETFDLKELKWIY